MNLYYVCDEGVDKRANNQEHIYSYEATDLETALAVHKLTVGTKVVAAFDLGQHTVGFKQWG